MYETLAEKPRKEWATSIYLQRAMHGCHSALLSHLRENYQELVFNFTRMSGNQFDELLSLIGKRIKQKTIRLRKPISPSESTLSLRKTHCHSSTTECRILIH